MGSFLEKYSGSEWDEVADEVITILEVFEKLLKNGKCKFPPNDLVIVPKLLGEIKKLKKDFVE